ncbi:3-oxoacid CoA-transferase subunit B [Allopusillimonas ginsengisoli]|nr:3-oxoacid CoA-transferase subunit B [Allopusillimonas ginsengisoli]
MQQGLTREQIARIAAMDIPEGSYVNLGIGLPTKIADFMPEEREVLLHSEQGLLGLGPQPEPGEEDPDVVNAGKQFVTLRPGASVFSHSDSFLMIRGGHIDIACMGAFQVAENGDLANWSVPNSDQVPGVGGAMDLASGAKEIWALMEHCQRDGSARILTRCTYPITGLACVSRIYTNYAQLRVTPQGLVVDRIVPNLDLRALQDMTEARLTLAPDCSPYQIS